MTMPCRMADAWPLLIVVGLFAAATPTVMRGQHRHDALQTRLRILASQPREPSPPPGVEPLPSPPSVPAAPHVLNGFPIDLPTALQLADAENVQVALAREQIRQAYAAQSRSQVLWLPSLRAGVHWNKHDGPLQESRGTVIDVSRSSLYTGAVRRPWAPALP